MRERSKQVNWQPIETAPKDQSEILILQWKRIHHAQWGGDFHKTWIGVGGTGFFDYATHWMPLPEPPNQ